MRMNPTPLDPETAMHWATGLWYVLLGVWLVLWSGSKQDKKQEIPWRRLLHVVPLLIGFWLIFGTARVWFFLKRPLPPANPAYPWAGLILSTMGIALAIWARLSLGANWSSVVTLKKNHELIRKGLYRWIRHPIYTGILLAAFGSALIRGQFRGWLGVLTLFLSFYFKARREETFLRQEFGAGFEEHARQTGMFFPKLI